jgi:hypothetical protein
MTFGLFGDVPIAQVTVQVGRGVGRVWVALPAPLLSRREGRSRELAHLCPVVWSRSVPPVRPAHSRSVPPVRPAKAKPPPAAPHAQHAAQSHSVVAWRGPSALLRAVTARHATRACRPGGEGLFPPRAFKKENRFAAKDSPHPVIQIKTRLKHVQATV